MIDSQQQQLKIPRNHIFLPCNRSPSNMIYVRGRSKHASVHLYLRGSPAIASAQVALLAKSFRNKLIEATCLLFEISLCSALAEHSLALGRVALRSGLRRTSVHASVLP